MAHGDYTGNTKAALARRVAQEQQIAASQSALVSQVVTDARKEVIDLFVEADFDAPKVPGYVDGEIQMVDMEDPRNKATLFTASEDLEDVTIGKDRTFSLELGRVYKAPLWVVEHLDEKELVRH